MVKIMGITLISREEMKGLPTVAVDVDTDWWLRSPGLDRSYAMFARGRKDGDTFVDEELGIRPALQYQTSDHLQIGDKVDVFGYGWTVISDNLMLCDEVIGKMVFREDWEADNANSYESSDIKKWLESWYLEHS